MNFHERCIQQAIWTRELRKYLFQKAQLSKAKCVLEVGCGTGAILGNLAAPAKASIFGLDFAYSALRDCRLHVPAAFLTRSDACSLPYPARSFDITYCHFLLMWVGEPLQVLQEMKRVTKRGGCVLALAEPDYDGRVYEPIELASLGNLQAESLSRQGADVSLGAHLAELFQRSDIRIRESGTIGRRGSEMISAEEWDQEWAVLEGDLAGLASAVEIGQVRRLVWHARTLEDRILYVPTYFAWGQV